MAKESEVWRKLQINFNFFQIILQHQSNNMRSVFLLLSLLAASFLSAQDYQFRQFTPLKNIEIRNLIMAPGARLMAATPGGVYVSTNQGASWELYNKGLSEVADERWRIGNAIRNIWDTPAGLFIATDYGALFKEVDNKWVHVAADYRVEDLAYFNGAIYFAGASVTSFYERDMYKLSDLNEEAEFIRAMPTSFFNVAEPLTALSDGIIVGEPNRVIFYDGTSFTNISPSNQTITPWKVLGNSSDDFYVIDMEIFVFAPYNNTFHYNGSEYSELNPNSTGEFLTLNPFELNGELYLYGLARSETTVVPRLVKRVDLILTETWLETSGYQEGVAPAYKGIIELGPTNYLYFGTDRIRRSNSNMGSANTVIENNIYNGSVEDIAGMGKELYYLVDRKMTAFDTEEQKTIESFPSEENFDIRAIGNTEDYAYALKFLSFEDSIKVYKTTVNEAWSSASKELDIFSINTLGTAENKLDFVGYREEGETQWDYVTYDLKESKFYKENWKHSDTSFVSKILRTDKGKFTFNHFLRYTRTSNGSSFSSSTDYWSVHYQVENGSWQDVVQDRRSYGVLWDHFRALEKTIDGDVFLVIRDADITKYGFNNDKTLISKFDEQSGKFQEYLVFDEDLKSLRYVNGVWRANINNRDMYSADLENWFEVKFSGLPEAAEVEVIKRVGEVVYCGTQGNGLFWHDLSTSIPDLVLENTMLAYPSPSSGIINLSTKNVAIANCKVFNLQGGLVYNLETERSQNLTLDLNHLSSGVYIVQTTDVKGQTQSQKVVIEK